VQLLRRSITQPPVQLIFPIVPNIDHRKQLYKGDQPKRQRRAQAALPVPAAGPAKERDADGRTSVEARWPVPASGGAVLESTAMVSITVFTLPCTEEDEDF
jgi:hypothetical protein